MLDSTIVRARQQAATGRKRGRRQGSRAFLRWTEHQNPSADQRSRRPGRLPDHRRASWRVRRGSAAAGWSASGSRVGLPRLRFQRHRYRDQSDGCKGRSSHRRSTARSRSSTTSPVQASQPHRTLLQSAKTVPKTRHTLLQAKNSLPSHRELCLRSPDLESICRNSPRLVVCMAVPYIDCPVRDPIQPVPHLRALAPNSAPNRPGMASWKRPLIIRMPAKIRPPKQMTALAYMAKAFRRP
jgi:hypothetical protein